MALCAELKNLHIISVDCSAEALAVASGNLQRHKSLLSQRNNHVQLVESDLFSELEQDTQLDFIVSNPPYIPTADIPSLQTEVSEYEPCVALDGGPDGLRFYRYLLEKVPSLLKPNGEMFLEIGFDREPALTQLLFHSPVWASSKFIKDLQGNMRVWNLQKQ